MSVSDITVSGLTATPSFRGNKLAWAYSDPRAGALPNIALDMVEVHASTTNDRATATKVGEGIIDFLHAGLVEEQTYYYWIKARDNIGGVGAWHPSGSTSGVPCVALGISGLAFGLANGKLVASVASNNLTISLKTAASNDPSASDPVYVAFRNSTLATGNYTIRTVSAALSITVASGGHLGTSTNNQPFRIWVVLFDDAGTLRLGVFSLGGILNIRSFNELGVASSVSGTPWTLSAQIYTGTAVTSKPYRLLGYLDWTSGLATAGSYNTGPDVIQMWSPAIPKPGDEVQYLVASTFGADAWTTTIPYDGTIPQITEGTEANSSGTVAVASNINFAEIEICASGDYSAAGTVTLALFRTGVSNALCAATVPVIAGGAFNIVLRYMMQIGSSGLDLKYRIGADVAGTGHLGNAGAKNLGSVRQAFIGIRERMG